MKDEATPSREPETDASDLALPNSYGRELATINSLIAVASSGLNLSALLDTALKSALQLLDMPVGAIMLWDTEKRCLSIAAQHDIRLLYPEPDVKITEGDFDRYLLGRVFRTQLPLFESHVTRAPQYADTLAAHLGAVSVAVVPLTMHEQRLGILFLASKTEHVFSDADRRIVRNIARQVAISVENARLYQAATRQAEQMRLLVDVGQRLNAILDLDELLKAIVTEVQAGLGCRLVAVGLVEAKGTRLVRLATPQGLASPDEGEWLSPDTGYCGWVVRHKVPLCVADVRGDDRFYTTPAMAQVPILSAAVVPIILGNEVLGVLNAESEHLGAFNATDVTLLQTIAAQAAVAISNARSYAEAEGRAQLLRGLLDTTRELNSTLDLRRLLESIAHHARTLIDVESCIIFLLNPDTGVLSPVVAEHEWASEVLGMTLHLGEGISGRVAQTGVGEIVNDALGDPQAVTVPDTPEIPEALLVAPLKHQGHVIGVMTLSRLGGREFAPLDLEIANSFASQAAIAVENARLYTESRRHARKLELAQARLERTQNQLLQAEKLSAVGQLAGGMAHELNNPLTAIMGFAQLLEAEPLSAGSRSDVRRILAAVGRAQKIVANLLTFARQQRIKPQVVDLAALVERILRLHSKEALGAVSLRQELAADLPEVRLDPLQFEPLLLNLLRHAGGRASEVSGGTVTVRLGQPERSTVRLEVEDNGAPISADLLPHIFDPFFTSSEGGEEPSMGLAACYGIVCAHRGRITAEPGVAGGTRFVVDLPLDAEAGPAPSDSPAERSLLVVTADDALAELVTRVVQAAGHQPTWCMSAEAALAEVVVSRYDGVICHAALPGMDIRTLFESIRANDLELAQRFVAIGAENPQLSGVRFLATPVDEAHVREALQQLY